jgi:transposase
MEAISGRKTIQEIAADHAIHPIQVSQWKKQLLEGASDLFTRGKKTQAVKAMRQRRRGDQHRFGGHLQPPNAPPEHDIPGIRSAIESTNPC